MITLYKPYHLDFRNNGLGVIDRYISDDVVTWKDNGQYSFSFAYPIFGRHGFKIKGECIVKTKTPTGYQLFRIHNVRTENGMLYVDALHISYDLAFNLIEDTFIVEKNGSNALSQMASKLQFKQPFTFSSDIKTIASSRVVRKNPIEFLIDESLDNSFVNRWGGHLVRDNYHLSMVANPERKKVVTLRDRKNVKGYTSDLDHRPVATRIMPQGFDGLFLPEKYIDSPLINRYPTPRIQIVEFPEVKAVKDGQLNEEGTVPLNVAYDLLRKKTKECYSKLKFDEPKASYKLDFIELKHTEAYKEFAIIEDIMPNDRVNFIHDGDLEITANLVAFTYRSSTEEYLTMDLGNFKPTFTSVMNEVQTVSNSIPIISNDISKNHTDMARGAYGGSVILMNPKDIGEGESELPFLQVFMNKNTLRSSNKFLVLNSEGLGFIKGPFDLKKFSASWGIDGILSLGEGMLRIGTDATGRFLENTSKGLEFFNKDTTIGSIGVASKQFPGFSEDDDVSKKALAIEIVDGEFFKIQTSGKEQLVTGIYVPNPKKPLKPGFGTDFVIAHQNKGTLHIIGEKSSVVLDGDKVKIVAKGGLFLNNEQVYPGQGSGGGGGWNGIYPPELTSSADKFAWELYSILLSKGYSKQSACGILGNVEGEVGPSMNPDTEQQGGPAYGCVQWDGSAYPLVGSPTSNGRQYVQRLMDAARINDDYKTMKAQAQLIEWCNFNGQWIGQVSPTSVTEFKKLGSPQQAAYAFELNFERPAAAHPERQGWALEWYNKFKDLKQPTETGKYIRPMTNYTVTSEFGWRNSPLGNGMEFHNAIDLANGGGTPILASNAGTVVKADGNHWSWYGNYIVIKHADGLFTGYAHLSQINVKEGQQVSQGQVIGLEGATGPVTGPHLHFQFMKAFWPNGNDDFINPRQHVQF